MHRRGPEEGGEEGEAAGTLKEIRVEEPFAAAEIARELRSVHEQSREIWASFSTTELFFPLGGAWSPADNVRHLLKSTRPVLRALRTAKVLLALRFGAGLRGSRSYAEIRERYLERLAAGVTAGRYTPRPLGSSDQTDEQRRALMTAFDQVIDGISSALSGWREWQLDRLRLPHPALGRITVREMLFFTVYHNLHHARNVAKRAGGISTPLS